jgi:hypothetical protein
MMRTSFEHAGLRIVVESDPAPGSPRDRPELMGQLVFWHPTAILGDEPPLEPGTTIAGLLRERGAKVWLPLWAAEVEGRPTLRAGEPEDADLASANGLIYAASADVRRRMRLLRISRRAQAEARAILRQELEDYARFVRKEMLRFWIYAQDGEPVDRRGGLHTEAHASEEAMWLAEHHAALLTRYAPERLIGPSCPPPPRAGDPSDDELGPLEPGRR